MADLSKSSSAAEILSWHEDPSSFAQFKDVLSPLPTPDPILKNSRVKQKQGFLKRIRNLTHDTYEVVIEYEDDGDPFNFRAGQYAVLTHKAISRPRSYSLAKAPEAERPFELTFFIRYVTGGEFTSWLTAADRTGEPFTVAGPMGKFLLDRSSDPILCIAGGSGMSAIHSILEYAAHVQLPRDAYYVYSARSQQDLYCLEAFEELARRWHPEHKLHFIPTLSREPHDSDWQGVRGRGTSYVGTMLIGEGALDVSTCRAYFCGPPEMIDTGMEILIAAGMPKEHILYDKFEDMSSPAPVIDNAKCVLCDECLIAKPQSNCIVEVSKLYRDAEGNVTGYDRVVPAQSAPLYYNMLYIDESVCIRCGACVEVCPAHAISPSNSRNPKVLRAAMLETSALDLQVESACDVPEDLPFVVDPSRDAAPVAPLIGVASTADDLGTRISGDHLNPSGASGLRSFIYQLWKR
jgi:CDP-4-dehydro-6-deoxyglucose reductase